MMKKDIDFYKSYKIMRNKPVAAAATSRPIAGAAAAVIVILAIAVASMLTMYIFLIEYDIDIATLSAGNADPVLQQQVKSADEILTEAKLKSKVVKNLGNIDKTIESYQQLENADFVNLYSALPTGTKIASFSYAGNGKINLTCVTTSKDAPAEYAANLDNLGITAAVGYTGFSQNGSEVTFTIDCVINEKAGGSNNG